MKKLERQGGMKDHQFLMKWSSGRRASKEFVIPSPHEFAKKTDQQLRKDLSSTLVKPRDWRSSGEHRSMSLDRRGLDSKGQQRPTGSAIVRDNSYLSDSKRIQADNLPKDGEGNLVLHELFKKEFIGKLSDRAKQRDTEITVPDDFVRPEDYVKPVRIHARHSRHESIDLVQVIGSPKKDSLERVRVMELPRTPRSPLHEKTRSPVHDKFSDPEWMSKCEKLNIDHLESHHKRTLSSADDETSKDFILSRFFETPSSTASPRELYDILTKEEMLQQEQMPEDVLPNKHNIRNVPRKQAAPVEGKAQKGLYMPWAPSTLRRSTLGNETGAEEVSAYEVEVANRLAAQEFSLDDVLPGPSGDKSPMRRVNDQRFKKVQGAAPKANERVGHGVQTWGSDSEELLRAKEAMLKSLKLAAAVDQAHFLRVLQDHGAVQSSSPLSTAPSVESGFSSRSPIRGTDTLSNLLRSPIQRKSPSAVRYNVREVKGNAVEGSAGEVFPRSLGEDSPDRWQDDTASISSSTRSSGLVPGRRRSAMKDSTTGGDSPRQEPFSRNGQVVHQSSSERNSGEKSTVLQTIEESRERRRRRAQRESEEPPGASGMASNQQASKTINAASRSSKSRDSKQNGEDPKESMIQKLMKRATARGNLLRQESCDSQISGESILGRSSSCGGEVTQDLNEQRVHISGPENSQELSSSLESQSSGNVQRTSPERNVSSNPSGAPSCQPDDPGPLKTPISSVSSVGNAEDISELIDGLKASLGLPPSSPHAERPEQEGLDDALNNSECLRAHVEACAAQPQRVEKSEVVAQKSKVVESQRTPERALLSAASGPWSPGRDDSGSDGSSIDQPSPVSVLTNPRTPFTEDSQLGALERQIDQLDRKLRESQECSQKYSADGSTQERGRGVSIVGDCDELMNQEVLIVELTPQVTTPRRKQAKPVPTFLEPAGPAVITSDELEAFRNEFGVPVDTEYEGRRSRQSRELSHRHAAPIVASISGSLGNQERSTDFRKSLEIIAGSASDFRKSLEIFDLETISARGKRRWDLVYARDVLVASGFGRDVPSGPMTKWHSVSEPIDPALFEKMEDYYKTGRKFLGCERLRRLAFYQPDHLYLQERIKASVTTKQDRYDPMHRCHLFDVVNELLAKKLEPYRIPRNPWVKAAVMRPRPTGKMLLEEIWREMCDQMTRTGSTSDQKILHIQLENLIGEDLYKRSHWFPSPDFDTFIERVVYDLEKKIFADLLLDTAANLQSFAN